MTTTLHDETLVTGEDVAQSIQGEISDDQIDSDADRRERLRKLGIYTPQTLKEAVERETRQPYLVEGLLGVPSVNLLVGDSGLGKTPLAIQIGVCVAAGVPLFGLRVEKGPVLYCDAESGKPEFFEMLQVISRFLGLREPPRDFYVWSPHWEIDSSLHEAWCRTSGARLTERVKEVQPSFVVADALRTFWPEAETKNQVAAETIASLRKSKGVTWLLLHHRRKENRQGFVADLVENPHGWFQESAGAFALVNQSDTRIGVTPHPGRGDLLMAGFMRGSGTITSLDLERVTNDGVPIGYRLLTGAEHLSPNDQAIFNKLGPRFQFKDVSRELGGTSGSNAARFVKRCRSLQIVNKDGTEYIKTALPVERVE